MSLILTMFEFGVDNNYMAQDTGVSRRLGSYEFIGSH
jgi:hypothetical protein